MAYSVFVFSDQQDSLGQGGSVQIHTALGTRQGSTGSRPEKALRTAGVIQWDWFLQGEPPSLIVLGSVCSISRLLQAEVGPVD